MTKIADSTAVPPGVWREIDDLYHKVLELFYENGSRAKALPHALRLLQLLDKFDPNAETLLGMSGRWLVAELDGDLGEAIRYREKELAALRNHIGNGILATGGLEPDEFSDRLDLLASNYLNAGRYDEALAALAESESFCKAHNIPFDGKAIRSDIKRAVAGSGRPKRRQGNHPIRTRSIFRPNRITRPSATGTVPFTSVTFVRSGP